MWSFKSPEPAALWPENDVTLHVLYSLNLLNNFSVEISKVPLRVMIDYVCISHLGVEFLKKCDGELTKKLKASSEG
jgi:hypothetical protein